MNSARSRRFLVIAVALCAVIIGYALFANHREASDTQVVAVALDPADPSRTRIGQLEYLGGLDIPRMGENIGGLSGLRWDAQSGRLLAITDDARWVWMTPVEVGGRLTGIADLETGPLLGVSGEVLTGKEDGDSEGIIYDPETGWAVSFERNHRILSYGDDLSGTPVRTLFDPEAVFGELEGNSGIEAFALGNQSQLICVQRLAAPSQANCQFFDYADDTYSPFPVNPPQELVEFGAVPTDADALQDGTYTVLFRSWSPADDNRAAIVTYTPEGERRELMTITPPLTTDNFEGLAVREEAGRTFLYLVSDDNFSSNQRTLLMKFEIVGGELAN
ncbi:hypothetical protein NAP1_00535 [Erythrobacter sp. NAP1]|uniref:esterase-like activity of phytase family protein n=1 Tax=Erythrobacter sp. NAP1 TaxID=237727 RepID=UPI0000686F88|nr:esterase-like activity of phytase family protein [Erythrobacter sp. NAP1]EAQ29213.1 hypothetical protein NAP1_00535 [Erythrobacter sp. NAP1]